MPSNDTCRELGKLEEAVEVKPRWKPRGSTESAGDAHLRFPLRGQHSKKDLVGKRFGRLLVLDESGRTRNRTITWRCICDCGNETIAIGADMAAGKQVSCGCQRNEASVINGRKAKKHGLSFTPIASARKAMVQRCYNPNNKSYHCYGGRGLRVCQGIKRNAGVILSLLGERPSGMSIDRKNNNGYYSCGACPECIQNGWPMNIRWATPMQQSRNSRLNRMVTIDGETHCVSEWCEIAGISRTVIAFRLNHGIAGRDLLKPSRTSLK